MSYVSKTEARLTDKTTCDLLAHARRCDQCGVEMLLLGCYALACGIDDMARFGALTVLCAEGDRIVTEGLIRDGIPTGMPPEIVEAGRQALALRNAQRAATDVGVVHLPGERAKA